VLARWHARLGPALVVLVVVHVLMAVGAWSQGLGVTWVAAFGTVVAVPDLAVAAGATAVLAAVLVTSARRVRHRFAHESWHAVHLLVYPALIAAFVHELAGPDLAGRPGLRVCWTLAHTAVLALVLRYRIVAPLELAWRHRLHVHRVIPEADDVVSLVLRGRHLHELEARAGQFFRWRFVTATTWRGAHPFSLSALPAGDYLRITVKALGDRSRWLQAVRPGTFVIPEGPSGALSSDRRRHPAVLLIAGGVGVTPMRTLFETIDAEPGRLTLLYRASHASDVVFRRELEALARRRGAAIVWMIGPSTDPSLLMTADLLRSRVPDVAERDVYLCASPGFARATRDALEDAGLPRRQLHDEVFSF
jgi:ferredoxin-NADP reductase